MLLDAWRLSASQVDPDPDPIPPNPQTPKPPTPDPDPNGWRLSASQPAAVVRCLPSRLNWVLREAGFACSHSMAVGIVGFLSCGLSSWLPIAHFGVFCALVVVVQLTLALLFLPVCLVLYHDWLEMKPNLCCICCLPAPGGQRVRALQAVSTIWEPQALTSTEHYRDSRAVEATLGMKPAASSSLGSRVWQLPRLLSTAVQPQLAQSSRRRPLLLAFALLAGPVGFSVTRATSSTQQRARLHASHPLQRTRHEIERTFEVSSLESTVRTTLVWGVDGISSEGVNLLRNSSYLGELEWRPSFVFDEAAQLHLASVCDELRHQPWVRKDAARATTAYGGGGGGGGSGSGSGSGGGSGLVHCFLDDFRAWVVNGSDAGSFGVVFPVPDERDPALALASFVHEPQGMAWQPYVGAADGRIAFVAVGADLRLRASASRTEAEAAAALVASFVDRQNRRAPPSAGPALPSADGELWAWMRAQAELPSEAILGSIRTAAFSGVALLLVTANLPLTALALVAVVSATLSLLALLVACGWALGSTEAVLACVTPALLTPPAALVLRAYVKAEGSRLARASYAFDAASAPIASGWLALAVAIAPILACHLDMEFKVAATICFVALCVVLWIGVFLPMLLAELGPTSARPGLPIAGSLPWALMRTTLSAAERVPIEGQAPCTLSWLRIRRRQRAARAALQRALDAESGGGQQVAMRRGPQAYARRLPRSALRSRREC